ncbi:MAG: hypothetical protein AAFQ85_08080 [Pseudomonadota bacterium]
MTQSEPIAHSDAPLKAKIIEMVALSAAFGVVFLIVNAIHFRTLPVSVIFYACILDAIIASIIVLFAFRSLRAKMTTLHSTEIALVAIASNLLILLYALAGPTVIDRSLSIYIVEKIDFRGGEVAEDAMPEIILKEFWQEYRVPEVRMTEQMTSGTVDIKDGCIHLTARGRILANFTRFYRRTFLPQRRVIGDDVTNALSHPYQNAPVLVPFECPQAQNPAGDEA